MVARTDGSLKQGGNASTRGPSAEALTVEERMRNAGRAAGAVSF